MKATLYTRCHSTLGLVLFASVAGAILIGAPVMAGVHWDGLYHNNTNLAAETEIVPAELTPGETNTFLEIDYANDQVNVFFLTDNPAADGGVSCRVRFYTPQEGEELQAAQWQANVVLSNTVPFHATPASGVYTGDVWKATWQPPNGFTGTVYYAPQVLEDGGVDIQSLVRTSKEGAAGEWGINDGFWQTHAQYITDGDPTGGDFSFQWTNALPLDYDGFYFNSTHAGLPESEVVPGLGGPHFFEYSNDPDVPSYVYTLAPLGGLTSARTRFWFGGGPGEMIRNAAWFSNVEISVGDPFHEFPTSGTATVDVWRTAFYTPANWGTGGTHVIYYATELTVPKNGTTWLAANLNNADGAVNGTNGWPTNAQVYTSFAPADARDWSYTPTAAMARAESLTRDWAYHNNTALDAQREAIPAMGARHFVDVDYAATSTTFYVLLDNPSIAKVPGETPSIKVRVYNSYNAATDWLTMSWAANASLSAGDTFHGLPIAGNKTLDVWKAEWQHPTNALGSVTNQFNVYYAIQLESLAGSGLYSTDLAYLTASVGAAAGWGTNNYVVSPQLHGPDFAGHDFSYTHQWRDEGDDDADGMPNWWEETYFGGKTNGLPGGNDDTDALSNLEEWIADTIPNDSNSVYVARMTGIGESDGVVTVEVGPGTSTLREYDLLWKTNLLDAAWSPVGLNVAGRYDGGVLTLTASNGYPRAFFKSAVKLP